ncbi:4a-hydroxytetrahydrobiopterin dehydratase [Frigidibacter sp. ROC022]|uniref:4a-hydroxytetrahydrobiopterin dehydratase n=1 Tax=Frigidibacter sp. ROC022 TaxID=2971796 RepID=UPI00215AE461|nr:4a-hydroxytetrahydrobiopterin dehydratase [Frigidibacter sp. ROC022]MCR8724862.1 4a-hydroxytetrahydrobiopterin dehydratase [Frigidibacter sp. ROC022]
MTELLTGETRAAVLDPLLADGWIETEAGTALTKTFTFHNFSEAFSWMTRVALLAEKIDHHPEWTNVYKRVEVRLSTHSAGGLTALDVEMATAMDAFATH